MVEKTVDMLTLLEERMIEQGMSQNELAKRLSVDAGYLSKVFRDKANVGGKLYTAVRRLYPDKEMKEAIIAYIDSQ